MASLQQSHHCRLFEPVPSSFVENPRAWLDRLQSNFIRKNLHPSPSVVGDRIMVGGFLYFVLYQIFVFAKFSSRFWKIFDSYISVIDRWFLSLKLTLTQECIYVDNHRYLMHGLCRKTPSCGIKLPKYLICVLYEKKSKISGKITFFDILFVPRYARDKKNVKKISNPREKVIFPEILLFIPL